MEMIVDFPGGAAVDAHFKDFTVHTDQPAPVGANTGPAPFDYFLASLATCAGFYVISFCQQRQIPTEGIRLVQNSERDRETGMVTRVTIDIQLPPGFPERYRAAVIRSAELCAVKKHIEHAPAFEVRTSEREAAGAH